MEKRTLFTSLAALTIGITGLIIWSPTINANPNTSQAASLATTASASSSASIVVPTVEIVEPTPVVVDQNLIKYIDDSMHKWRPTKTNDALYLEIATAIVNVVSSEPPIFKNDTNHAKTATLVASIGFFESGFVPYVWQGLCNDFAWRKTYEGKRTMFSGGDCDGGYAYSGFQIHPEGGIMLDSNAGWHWKTFKHGVDESAAIDGPALIASKETASRVALHFLRASLERGGGLSAYTGEAGPMPKAEQRLGFAKNWSTSHPYKSE